MVRGRATSAVSTGAVVPPAVSACIRTASRRQSRRTAPKRRIALLVTLALSAAPALAQQSNWSDRTRAALVESSSAGMLPADERSEGFKGWLGDAWEGARRIYRDGQTHLLLPLHTFHPPFKYENRFNQNHYPWGAGLARFLVDEKDNERMVFALGFSDSHYDFQPMVGYGWIARWPLAAGLKGGLGYTAFLTARADANYFPFPAVLPLASIGTDQFTLYGTWIPTTDVLFFFARMSFDGKAASPAVGATGAPPGGVEHRNLLYGAMARVKTDAYGIDSVASSSDSAPLYGYRRFVAERVAVDVSYVRSGHTLDLNGARLGTFDVDAVTVAAQYHFPIYEGLNAYAGLGVSYSHIAEQDMPGYTLSSSSFSPALQAGASIDLGSRLVLTGGLSVSFPRHQLSEAGMPGTVKLSPVAFSLGLGFSF